MELKEYNKGIVILIREIFEKLSKSDLILMNDKSDEYLGFK